MKVSSCRCFISTCHCCCRLKIDDVHVQKKRKVLECDGTAATRALTLVALVTIRKSFQGHMYTDNEELSR